ncbi:MAG: hypothetical protein BWK73_17860 [Thiothrix lacustris]|uniref:Restriction endonuclease n=1 Tax=Thiothrix lacustris TaxID=525917 RepID=A0A1Y1QR09_9GAMM|nr:MAG: hypothetical protein BWK73_17860 [Thiothrix lacustris]
MKPWLFGNTTVRSPFRLRDGLQILQHSRLHGNLRGQEAECEFCRLLGTEGIIDPKGDDTCSVGRKWRSALTQMGFLYPKLQGQFASLQDDWGKPDTLTESGIRLVQAETVGGWQECFLRALAACYLPSLLEPAHKCPRFSPLRHTLAIMLELEDHTGTEALSFLEMALFIQRTSSENPISQLAIDIMDFRSRREASESKRKFDDSAFKQAQNEDGIKAQSIKDYADTNLRYLKATGLFQNKGRGIVFVAEKRSLIRALVQDSSIPEMDMDILIGIASGSKLPTDEFSGAWAAMEGLISALKTHGMETVIPDGLTVVADISTFCHHLEEKLNKLKEKNYALNQRMQVKEILAYLGLLKKQRNRSILLEDGETIEIPSSDAPAYFEWIIWRAFLAINSLVNPPWEARRFKVDQGFMPVSTAPGNGSDMIFEFDDMVLVVEVTLTSSSRQEAAEGEPVRRHVAQYAERFAETGKQIFGLFLAVNIDTNTANTFKLGEWYLKDDRKLDLHIVPMSLDDFTALFAAFAQEPAKLLPWLKLLLRDCRMYANKDAPEWKQKITQLTQQIIKKQHTDGCEY